MSTNVMGVAAFYHDSACALLVDGVLVAAAEEERFTRRKHDASLAMHAFRYCLDEARLTVADLACVAFYEDPRQRLARQLWSGLPALPALRESTFLNVDPWRAERGIRDRLGHAGPLTFVDHHAAHAASSYYCSGFDEAALLTVDAVGEWATASYGHGAGGRIELLEEERFPHSLGLFYSTITAYLGFQVNDGEAKVMGLAPYGQPRHVARMRELIDVDDSGRVRLNLDYYAFLRSDSMYSERLSALLGRPARRRDDPIEAFHADVARSAQAVLEDCMLRKVAHLHAIVACDDLCLAGGVALNCVANGRIAREGPFRRLFVQPAASDAGTAIGAAAIAHVELSGQPPRIGPMRHAQVGPGFSPADVRRLLDSFPGGCEDFEGREDQLLREVAARLARGQIVGWFQGRMEFGPRALGGRSILADPRDPGMRDRLNRLVKERESFRPFAPAVLAERAEAHFVLDHASPFMLETCQVRSPLSLPAITHVDGSARVQTVDASVPMFQRLLREFERLTGCPILLNTSFNQRDEPIVCRPEEAVLCFLRAGLDCLVLERHLLDHSEVPSDWLERVVQAVQRVPAADRPNVYALF